MEAKEVLINNIKEWVQLDNEIKTLQKETKDRRLRKKELTDELVEVMKSNEIDCFDMSDGKLIYSQNKIKAPLSKKHLLNSLHTFFEKDDEMAKQISKFILDSRETKIKETIRRKQQKNVNE